MPVFRAVVSSLFLVVSFTVAPAQQPTITRSDPASICAARTDQSKPCVTPPLLTHKTEPVYTEEARNAKIEGTVVLSSVIGKDGKAGEIRVERSLRPDLDEHAVAAVQQWEFKPATLDGNPVAVKVNVEVQFRLTHSADSLSSMTSKASAPSLVELQNLNASASDAYSRHDYSAAAKLSRQLTELAPQSRNAWNMLGMSLLELNQFDAAADALKKQIEIDPGSLFAYNNLGRVYQRQHKYDLAVEQFRKQLTINAQDRYAHANLGMVLYAEKKYSDAVSELEKALEITPNNSSVLETLARCDLELGKKERAVEEFSRAASSASSPMVWNNAAYQLATHNLELDRAQKWAESAVDVESAGLREVSLESLAPVQMDRANALPVYWDTLGWVRFVRGDTQGAEPFLRAAWELRQMPTIGNHLGQAYEKLGRREDAIGVFMMALAAATPLNRAAESDSITELKQNLSRLVPAGSDPESLSEMGRARLTSMRTTSIANPAKIAGTGDFVLLFDSAHKIVGARQVTGVASLRPMANQLASSKLGIELPDSSQVRIPRRGTLTCTAEKSDCEFEIWSSDQASDVTRKEAGSETAAKVVEAAAGADVYNNPGMGIRIKVPAGWKLRSEQPGSYNRPATVVFQKPDSLAAIILLQQHLEASPEMFRKLMEEGFSNRDDFARTSATSVVRDGVQGDRWTVSWKEHGIAYRGVMELFSAEDQHYYIMTEAPAELFERYAQNFDEALRSTQFPMLHVSAKQVLPQNR